MALFLGRAHAASASPGRMQIAMLESDWLWCVPCKNLSAITIRVQLQK